MTRLQGSDVVRVYRRLYSYVRPYRFVIVPAMLATTAFALVTGTVPFFMEDIFEQLRESTTEALTDAQANRSAPWRLPLLIAVVFALRSAMDFLTVFGLSWVGRSAIRDLRTELFAQYLRLPAEYFDRHASGDLISKLTFNTEQVADAVSNAIVVIFRDTMLVLVMIGVLLSFNTQLTLILAVIGPLIAILISAMSRAFRRYSTRIQNSMGDVTRVAGQALLGSRVVKIFAGQEYEQSRFDRINRGNFRLHLKLIGTRALGDALTQYVVVLGVAAIVFFVFSGWLDQQVDSPAFIGFVTAIGILLTPLKRLINTNSILQRGIAAADSIFEVLDERPEPQSGGTALTRCRGDIRYESVEFRYGDENAVLSGLSFHVPAGTVAAFVGQSGSGKSTLVSLLPRHYDLVLGRILLDGVDISTINLADLRRQISFVGQEVVLFDDTIAGNIAYGSLAASSRDEIERVAEAAHVLEFAADFAQGLDAPVGEQGQLLSGGQRQRIAIARALLKDAPILILDEATSALDSESERRVQDALANLMRDRTTLVIAHRLSTVESADQIIVLKDGRMTESGTHSELLVRGGDYAALYRMQFAE